VAQSLHAAPRATVKLRIPKPRPMDPRLAPMLPSGVLKGLDALTLVLLAACSRDQKPAPEPARVTLSPSSVVQVVSAPLAPVQAAQPPRDVVSDLVFDGEQLATCDEIDGPAETMQRLLDKLDKDTKKAPEGEVVRRGQTCMQATSNKPHQAACATTNKDGSMHMVTYHYAAKLVTGSDSAMRECLKKGGSWTRNDTLDAQREAAEQNVANARRSLKRLGVE
jgi:hypothetical protein